MQVGLLFLAIWLAPDSIDFGRIDTNQIVVVVLIVVLLVGVAMAVIFGVRRIRHAVLPPIQRALLTVWSGGQDPEPPRPADRGQHRRPVPVRGVAARVRGGLRRVSINFWTLLALNIGISVIASLVPIPGGGTAVSAVGLAGMITAFGVPAGRGVGRGAHPPARGDLPARDPGLVRHQRPGEEGVALTTRRLASPLLPPDQRRLAPR